MEGDEDEGEAVASFPAVGEFADVEGEVSGVEGEPEARAFVFDVGFHFAGVGVARLGGAQGAPPLFDLRDAKWSKGKAVGGLDHMRSLMLKEARVGRGRDFVAPRVTDLGVSSSVGVFLISAMFSSCVWRSSSSLGGGGKLAIGKVE